jgi:hypothetical protein
MPVVILMISSAAVMKLGERISSVAKQAVEKLNPQQSRKKTHSSPPLVSEMIKDVWARVDQTNDVPAQKHEVLRLQQPAQPTQAAKVLSL